jgi:hypothetical protein
MLVCFWLTAIYSNKKSVHPASSNDKWIKEPKQKFLYGKLCS